MATAAPRHDRGTTAARRGHDDRGTAAPPLRVPRSERSATDLATVTTAAPDSEHRIEPDADPITDPDDDLSHGGLF